MSKSRVRPIIIGICGGSGAGKSYFAQLVYNKLLPRECLMIEQDSYYWGLDKMNLELINQSNYDHPDAIEWDLLFEHLMKLCQFETVNIPIYNYKTHKRDGGYQVCANDILLLEGTLLLTDARIREIIDLAIYLDAPEHTRLIRRIERDVIERGRNLQSILHQYFATVKPMHDIHVEPQKQYAEIVFNSENAEPQMDEILNDILKFINDHSMTLP